MTKYLTIITLVLFNYCSFSQTTLFSEDFESYPINTFYLSTPGDLPNGANGCGEASRGNAADFNSTNIDFDVAGNSTNFLGVNPEKICGGFNSTYVNNDTLDLSGVSQLYFKGKYLKTSTLGWGGDMTVKFDNGTTDTTLNGTSHFPVNNGWENFVIELPVEYINDTVVMNISFFSGDGMAFDDLELSDDPTIITGTELEELKNDISIFPTIATECIYIKSNTDHTIGNYTITGLTGQQNSIGAFDGDKIDVSSLKSGLYFLTFSVDKSILSYRFIKQ